MNVVGEQVNTRRYSILARVSKALTCVEGVIPVFTRSRVWRRRVDVVVQAETGLDRPRPRMKATHPPGAARERLPLKLDSLPAELVHLPFEPAAIKAAPSTAAPHARDRSRIAITGFVVSTRDRAASESP